MPNPAPYDKTLHDGKTVDWLTHAALLEAEKRLGYRLTIVQGSYHKGVGASAGTHDGGGVVDLAPWDYANKLRVLFGVGFFGWHRTAIPDLWNEHIHIGVNGNTKLAPVAAAQEVDFRNHKNGLKGHAHDPNPHGEPITYRWPGGAAALKLEADVHKLLDQPATPKPAPKPSTASGALRIDGVDLSHWNVVTLSKLETAVKAGVRFAYLKATEGTGKDATYAQRRALVTTAGAVVGAYHFARPTATDGDAVAEARHFLAVAKPVAGDMRPMLDLEDRGGLSKAALSAWVMNFVAEVRKATGVTPLVYTPFDLTSTFGCPLWVARYHPSNDAPERGKGFPQPWDSWAVRQFSNGQVGKPKTVAGLGAVDLNTLQGGASTELEQLRIPVLHPEPLPPVTPPPVVVVTPPVVVAPAEPKPVAFPRWTTATPALTIWHGDSYPLNNSRHGIDAALRVGANAIDHDIHVTKDGHVVNTHWGKPLQHGFYDRSGHFAFGSAASIGSMTLEQVRQLAATDGGYVIRPVAEDAAYAAERGVTLCLEQKGDLAFTKPATWQKLHDEIAAAGCQAVVMSLPDMAHAQLALTLAGAAGFRTMLLTRGAVGKAWYDVVKLSAVKGPTARNVGLPKGIVRLGSSSVNATRYGCSVPAAGSRTADRIIRAKGGDPTPYRKA